MYDEDIVTSQTKKKTEKNTHIRNKEKKRKKNRL